jgi:hypothetical protein
MKANEQIAHLMSKEMDRKDFLKYGGGVVLAIIGITGLINALTQMGGSRHKPNKNGYGDSPYGS